MLSKLKYFTRAELTLWGCSVLLIVGSFVLFHQTDYLTLTASLIGATSLILNAKGNPAGQVLTIAFSLLYGYISLTCAYYGEMITYLGMTAPMSVFALISWLRNPYEAGKAEVRVNSISRREGGLCLPAEPGGDLRVLLHPAGLPHRQPAAQHHLGDDQLPGGLPDGPAQPAVRGGLRGQRPGAHRAVEPGGHAGFFPTCRWWSAS